MNVENLRSKFLWPLAKDTAIALKGQPLYKKDIFLQCVENLVDRRQAWAPIVGETKRTESESKLNEWVKEQTDKMRSLERLKNWNKGVSISLTEFPRVSADKRILATSKSILHLIDSTDELISCLRAAFGTNIATATRQVLECSIPALLFVTNSVESGGRAFSGDPFTGQVAAFARIFCYDILGGKERNFIAYYPHQLYTQFFNSSGNKAENKGVNVLQSLADLIITAKGVLIYPPEWRVL